MSYPNNSRILQAALVVTGSGALAAAIWTALIPADQKNAFLFGFSVERLVLLGGLLGCAAGLLVLAFRGRAFLERLGQTLSRPGWTYAAILAVLAFGTYTGRGLTDGPPGSEAFFARLLPLLAWLILAGAAAAVACGTLAFGPKAAVAPALPAPLIFLLVFTAAWFPRLLDLDRYVTVDEPTWLEGAELFYLALGRGDLAASHIAEHPAVPLFWAGSLSIRHHLAGETDAAADPDMTPDRLEFFLKKRGVSLLDLLATARLPIALLSALALAAAAAFAASAFGTGPALAGGLLAALDPFHIGHARLLTMDGLLASLVVLSLLAFLAHCRTGRRPALLVSGVAAGLAWLTKTPGLFLLPVIGILGVLQLLVDGDDAPLAQRLAGLARSFAAWGSIGLACFLLLFPALWAAPLATLSDMLTETLRYAAEGHRGPVFYLGQIFPDGRITGAGFAVVSFLWRTTPAVLAGLLAAAWIGARRRFSDPGFWLILIGAGLLLLFQSAGTKKFDRYFLHAYLALDFAAGFGLAWLLRRAFRSAGWASIAAAAALAAVMLWPAAASYPYFLSYYNPLLGGGRRAPGTMMIGWGEGLDEAGRYLAAKPDAETLVVTAWYSRGSFEYYFPGNILALRVNDPPTPDELEAILAGDYAVIYIHQWQRDLPAELLDILADLEPEHAIRIDGIEYVRIYALQK